MAEKGGVYLVYHHGSLIINLLTALIRLGVRFSLFPVCPQLRSGHARAKAAEATKFWEIERFTVWLRSACIVD